MGFFDLFRSSTSSTQKRKTVDEFQLDCGKMSMELATKHGLISKTKIVGDATLIEYCRRFNESVYTNMPSDYFGCSDLCEALGPYALQLGITLGGFSSTLGLSQTVFDSISEMGPAWAGINYLRIVGLEDEQHPFFRDLVAGFRQLYNEYNLTQSEKGYITKGMLAFSITGLTIYYEKGIKLK